MNDIQYKVSEEFDKAGYSKEEKYFYEQNRILLEKIRSNPSSPMQRLDWMKCPHCGAQKNTVERPPQGTEASNIRKWFKKLFEIKEEDPLLF